MSALATTSPIPTRQHTRAQWTDNISISSLTPWQIEAVRGVVRLASLPHDWDSYDSPPPLRRVVDISIDLIRALGFDDLSFDDLPVPPHLVPVSGGGIQFEWKVAQRELELEILPDGSIEFLKQEVGKPPEEGRLVSPVTEVQSLLAWLISG